MANYILTIYINWLFNVWSKNKNGRSWQTNCPDFLLNGFESHGVWQAPHKHPWWTTYLHFKGTGLSRLVFTYVKQQAHKHRHFKRIPRSIPDDFWLQNHTDFWDINQKYLFWNSLYKVCITSHHDVSIEELYLKQNNQTQIFNCGPARQARQKIETWNE